jgi:hypothetical protein
MIGRFIHWLLSVFGQLLVRVLYWALGLFISIANWFETLEFRRLWATKTPVRLRCLGKHGT